MIKSKGKAASVVALTIGDEHVVTFTDLIAKTGQAVGRTNGIVVFVLGPLPQESARIRISLVKAKYAVGELVTLLERSPDRVDPFCEVFGTCGGCQVQHLSYDAQLTWKRRLVENALRRLGGIEGARVARPIGMDNPRAYRNKMALVVDRAATGEPRLGFYQARSHEIVPIASCPIVLPQLDASIASLWQASRDESVAAMLADTRHLVARAGVASEQSVVSLSSERPIPSPGAAVKVLMSTLPGIVGLSNSFDPASENAVMGRKHVVLSGRAEIRESIDDVHFEVSAASFFQVNSEMVGKIFGFIRPQLPQVRRIVDLYCGAGTFALFFAKEGADVVGVEENPHAIREARANAEHNKVSRNATFVAERVERALRDGPVARAARAADVVFLDPPRKGTDTATLDAIADANVAHIWYLSCNPATLARDAAHLLRRGYRLGMVQPFDMFPQTGHIEAFATFHRADVVPHDFPVDVEADPAERDVPWDSDFEQDVVGEGDLGSR